MKLNKGDLILSKSGDWHEVVDVKGSGYIQPTNGHTQSRNEEKTTSKVLIYDGLFADWKSIEEVDALYTEVTNGNVLQRAIDDFAGDASDAYQFIYNHKRV